MKQLIFTLLTLVFLTSCSQSIKHDPKINEFINRSKEYVQLTDTANLTEDIKLYQEKMINYLAQIELKPAECYIWMPHIDKDSTGLIIPIRHYDGFEEEYYFEQKKKKMDLKRDTTEKGYRIMIHHGNWSGNDGNFLIDESNGTIISYKLWK